MNGIEKIIEKIEGDCRTANEEILAKAQTEAGIIMEQARHAAELAKEEILEAAKCKCCSDKELAVSKAEHEHKKAILAAKIRLINEVIGESARKAKDLPEAEYFDIIKSLVRDHAKKGPGLLRFSKKDLDRLPVDFEETLNKMLSLQDGEKGIRIDRESMNINSGCVIVYHDIEQNCSFDALMDARLDEIKDILNQELFSKEPV